MTVPADVYSHQILRLEHEASVLYAEVIQTVLSRNLYWLRPLALLHQPQLQPKHFNELPSGQTLAELWDLRQGPDLLVPQALCQPALDTEVIPLLAQLEGLKAQREIGSLDAQQNAQQQLQAFIRQLYQAQPEVFTDRV